MFHADGQTDRQTGDLTDMTKLMSLFAVLRTRLTIANPYVLMVEPLGLLS